MRVLLTAIHPVGGIRTFFRYVYGNEVFDDTEFALVAPNAEDLATFLEEISSERRIELIETSDQPFDFARSVRRAINQRRPDLLHAHGFSASLFSQLGALGLPVPQLTTTHDVILPGSFSGFRGAVRKRILARALSRLDAVHAVGGDNAENLLEHFPEIDPSRLRAIRNGVATEAFSRAESIDVRAEAGLPEDTALIGFLGRFMAQKGFRTLIHAVRIIKEQNLITRPFRVVTLGWGGFIREDYAYIDSLGLAEHFVQLPGTNAPERWMKGFDVIAMPSRWEACPLLPMEVLAAGVPIVGSDCIGMREVLEDTPAKVVPVGDEVALAHGLVEQLATPAREAAQAFQATAVTRFDRGATAAAIKSLYAELAQD